MRSIHVEMVPDADGVEIATRTRHRVGLIRPYDNPVPRTSLTRAPEPPGNLWRDALAWAYPWHRSAYPGHHRGIVTALGREVPRQTVQWWKRTGRPAVWAAERMADHIEARALAGLRCVASLRSYIEERKIEPNRQGAHLRGPGSLAARLPQ